MRFSELALPGVWLIEMELHCDDRGYFARTWCREEFERHGLCPDLAQCSVSFNRKRGTLRGMHFQAAPHEETKLVRCLHGVIYDVVLDLRPDAPTWGRWLAVELSAQNRSMIYIPHGCAHGFQSLTDGAEVQYQISTPYRPESAQGVRWNDPTFAIRWPMPEEAILSDRDRHFPLWPEHPRNLSRWTRRAG